MKVIYLDHNIIQYFSGLFPANVDAAAELAALEAVKSDPGCRFVLSPWNIHEAASGTDLKRIEACASLIEGLNLWFIPDHPVLAKREMRRHVFKRYFGVDMPLECPFATSYSQHLVDIGIKNVPVGKYTAAGMIRYLSRNPSQSAPIDQYKEARPEILKQLQEAKAAGAMSADFERQLTETICTTYFPERDPNGTPIPLVERDRIVGELVANYQEVLRGCPTLWIDDLLADFRIKDHRRNPNVGDAIDLMHIGSALVYCDAFVSFDRYTRSGADYAAKKANTGCKVVPLLSSYFPIGVRQ